MASSTVPSGPPPGFIPGTVHLVDLHGTMSSRHADGGARDIVLIPTPSSDPDDPLNWSPRRKFQHLCCLGVYCLAIGIASAAIYSVLVPISEATDLTLGDLNAGTGYMFLTLGWGCLVWQPLAQKYGKRPVYLFSLITTLWFTHERGTYMGYYALFLCGSNFLAPVIAGFINDGQGWEWVLHWCAIFCGIGFLICFFFMEETNYQRMTVLNAELYTEDPTDASVEKGTKAPSDSGHPTPTQDHATTTSSSPTQKTFVEKIMLFRKQDFDSRASLKDMVIRPFIYFSLPVVVFSGFVYGAILCYFNVLNGTASLILSSPPYNFRASIVGLSYVSCLIGVAIGFVFSGYFGDSFTLWKARRNQGIMEPEFRLWLFSVLMVVVPGSLLLWGVGAAHQVHWFGLIFAMGALSAGVTAGCQLTITYCIDSYKELGADAIVTVILIRNTMSFAVSYGITPWVTDMGWQNAFLVAAFAALAVISLFLVMIKKGRQFRQDSAETFWKYRQHE
ncbi:major facilitator superfamily transporter [Colletotrichum karsti]|uniref:Major facilitator superfamily transporter n=1 Tax=Colletotrichum karsti TaxID=1095194 RepID=A0A9P6I381_9PEZI|nr:major facilitator superfamily transporter [Colletotrichum karsti]KAF9871120.1 major facilitator superfamily transporter [Colletotrichum karsti]